MTDVDETKEPVVFAPVKRGKRPSFAGRLVWLWQQLALSHCFSYQFAGGASVHDERIVHGSGGNKVRFVLRFLSGQITWSSVS